MSVDKVWLSVRGPACVGNADVVVKLKVEVQVMRLCNTNVALRQNRECIFQLKIKLQFDIINESH